MINMRIKHLVIPTIVFAITFIVITFNYYALLANPSFDVGLLYSGTGVSVQSEEKAIWDTLLDIQSDFAENEIESEYEEISLNSYNKQKLTPAQFEEIISNKEAIFILGDNYNDIIEDQIEKNKKTKFILIDNSYDFTSDNVMQISFDENSMTKRAAVSLFNKSETKKLLYITSKSQADAQDDIATFKASVPEAQVAVMYVEDVNNNVDIITKLNTYIEAGYDGYYIADPELNETIVGELKNKQNVINKQFEDETIKNNNLQPGENAVENKYQQRNLYAVTNTFYTYDDGIYKDTNNDGELSYPDNSIIIDSYIKDYELIFNDIIYSIMNYTFTPGDVVIDYTSMQDICQQDKTKC
jgi:hypothetical protein